MNGERFFVDTNVLLYASDAGDPAKQRAARLWLDLLWENGAGRLSWQVLHEFYVNAVRKVKTSTREARAIVEAFAAWRPVETTIPIIKRAWHWTDEAKLPYWDALIVAAAERAECSWLLTEDFQEGRKLGPLTVVNPFHAQPETFGLKRPV